MYGKDIIAKTIISEEAVVRKAGGKFKMNPLFPSTVAKIQKVRLLSRQADRDLELIWKRCSKETNRFETGLGLRAR